MAGCGGSGARAAEARAAWPSRRCRSGVRKRKSNIRTVPMLTLVLIIILVALLFDFFNGFNDAANSIATVVSTRVLSPFVAVAWAAFWNFVAAFSFGTAVAA